jgi:hypothetical protein
MWTPGTPMAVGSKEEYRGRGFDRPLKFSSEPLSYSEEQYADFVKAHPNGSSAGIGLEHSPYLSTGAFSLGCSSTKSSYGIDSYQIDPIRDQDSSGGWL